MSDFFKKSRSINRNLLKVMLACSLLAPAAMNAAVSVVVDESELKAAMLYNITKFVSWPGSEKQADNEKVNEFGICVFGDSEIIKPLQSLAMRNKKVRNKKLGIYQVKTDSELDVCKVLFLGSAVKADFMTGLDLAKQRPILTVSDREGGAELGGMINFIPRGKRIGFEVNLDEALESKLRLSSQLLKLGVIKTTLDKSTEFLPLITPRSVTSQGDSLELRINANQDGKVVDEEVVDVEDGA